MNISKVIYISGPMTGKPEYNYPEFNRLESELVKKGCIVVNPTQVGQNEGWEWSDYLKACINLLINNGIDTIVTLDGWEDSRGAKLEVHIGRELGMSVYSEEEFMSQSLEG